MDERNGRNDESSENDEASEGTVVNTVTGDIGPGAVVIQAGTVSFSQASGHDDGEEQAAEA
ncbi:hypothetical protein [Nocardiopsis suaedae]|uniref:Uncharacterized protein n=1 Tax=Nocardiopsis suaedae TaxID=3018444 RepID=A0ABT4TMJ9_9ACTN|nr:hypothetical protein [Nocardiopsis suaedae]MDA2805923.1 hypothetical protein [Nocardiopsis suaedae]